MDANIQIKQVVVNPSTNSVIKIVLADGTELNAGNTKYETQMKTVIPSTRKQVLTPDTNYEGLSKVTVGATPLEEKRVSLASLSAGDVLEPSGNNIGFSSIVIVE